MSETETVAILSMAGESGWCAYNIDGDWTWRGLIDEVRGIVESSYAPGETDADDDDPFVTICIVRKPAGWSESLPEFEGW